MRDDHQRMGDYYQKLQLLKKINNNQLQVHSVNMDTGRGCRYGFATMAKLLLWACHGDQIVERWRGLCVVELCSISGWC